MNKDKILDYILQEQARQELVEYVVLNFVYEQFISDYIYLRPDGKRFLFGLEYLVSFNKNVKIKVF